MEEKPRVLMRGGFAGQKLYSAFGGVSLDKILVLNVLLPRILRGFAGQKLYSAFGGVSLDKILVLNVLLPRILRGFAKPKLIVLKEVFMARNDGRGNDEMRKVIITRPFNKYAEGSCLIELGHTKVVCTASVEETAPPFLKGSGNGWVSAEYGMLPRSCLTRISRNKNSGRTFEIQRLIGRCLRSVTDTKSIGERTIWIDCDVLQGDGGTRAAAITGSFIALTDALSKLKKNGLIQRIPLRDFVAATSVGIVNGEMMLDLAYTEDSKADVDMNIAMTSAGEFIEIQGTAEKKTFSREQMDKLLKLAEDGISGLIDIQKSLLKDVF